MSRSLGNANNDRQLQMVAETGNIQSTNRETALKFREKFRGYLDDMERKSEENVDNSLQQRPETGNSAAIYGPQNRKYLYFWIYDKQNQNFNGIF